MTTLCTTPYVNTIPADAQVPYPGDLDIERRIRNMIRWNAMAMVVRGNRRHPGIGGHIATYASAATIWEVGFNHFFRGKAEADWGDLVYFQGHASPGVYARAFLEGRLSVEDLENFRHETGARPGLSSYPHPWLMPDFWEFPTVSMGIAAITAIYQARFNHYLNDRGLRETTHRRVWALLGDGELDEPESLGAITLAAREHLDNLTFVVNCNLQRLDGPVRGNGQIIQELEAAFAGAGWHVIKVIWGSDYDFLTNHETSPFANVVSHIVDGQMQKYSVSSGDFIRQDLFGRDPQLLDSVSHLSDDQIQQMKRGGHDPVKVFNAFHAATHHRDAPTVILAHTVKGYGMGEAGEGKNVTHQQKKMSDQELRVFRDRFDIPIPDSQITDVPFYQPPENSEEIRYLRERRRALGGFIPKRMEAAHSLPTPGKDLVTEFLAGTEDREVSTTMVFVRILAKLLRDPRFARHVVPIVPDEARTFGMEALFRQVGIYSHAGQLYEPVDSENLLYYREASDGVILEEGITEAGAMSSFIAAGTAHATHGINMIPFFIFYSMFGFQRVGDFIWAAGDARTRGFLLGATSGRTTLNGEGLQHQDGQSHLLASAVPNLLAYDPAFAYELAIIIRDGIRRMYHQGEDVFYYITLGNEFYPMPAKPEDVSEEAILKGMYRFRKSPLTNPRAQAHLLASGAILQQAIQAQNLLETYGVAADIWSVTSFKALYRDGCDVDRWNMLHPGKQPHQPYLTQLLAREKGVVVIASDYLKMLPCSLAKWIPQRLVALGTDGFGRSDGRAELRDFFEVDARFITLAALQALARSRKLPMATVHTAVADLGINVEKHNPAMS